MKTTDEELSAILFLDRHPGWTWADLMNTPDHVVTGLKMLDLEHAKQRK